MCQKAYSSKQPVQIPTCRAKGYHGDSSQIYSSAKSTNPGILKSMALISCIIAVFNGADYINEAIRSVLHQSMPVDQLIVVDDGSTDQTNALVAAYGDQLIHIKKGHSGIADTLNHGLQHATGDFITFLDADDIWDLEKTQHQNTWLTENPRFDAVFCHVREFVSPELSVEQATRLQVRPDAMRGLNKSCMMIRKPFFDQVGMFSVSDNMGDFIEWFTRAKAMNIQYEVLEDVLTMRRVHLHNFTRTQRGEMTNYTNILRRALELKRQNSQR